MENKKSKVFIILGIVVFIFLSIIAEMPYEFQEFVGKVTSTDYARITDIEYKAVLVDGDDKQTTPNKNNYNEKEEPQSKVVVTETITFDVRAASKNNPFWELWLGLGEEEIDGIRRTYKVNSVKQVMPDGSKVEWKESPKLYWYDEDYVDTYHGLGPNKWYHSEGPYSESARRYECLMFYVDGIYRDEITFEIEYEMYNAVLKYADCSELYIPMYSGDTCKYLESFKGEILIPNKDMPSEGLYEATGFGTEDGSFKMKKSTSEYEGYTTFSFNLKEKDLKFLKGYEYLEFDMYAMGEDKHVFADYATHNMYTSSPALTEVIESRNYYLNAPSRYNTTVVMVNVIIFSIGAIILILGTLKLVNNKRKYRPISKSEKDGYTFRDIPRDIDPKFAAELVFIKDYKPPKNNEDAMYASLLLSLARKKYIELIGCANDTKIRLIRPNISQQPQQPQQTQRTQMYNMSVPPRYTQPYSNQAYPNQMHPNQVFVQNTSPYAQQQSMQPNRTFGMQTPQYQQQSMFVHQQQPVNNFTQPTHNTSNQVNEVVDDREPLTYCEQQYYNLLLRHVQGDCITISTLERRIGLDWKFANDFQNKMKVANINTAGPSPYTTAHFYADVKTKFKKTGKNYLKFGIALLTVGNLISYWSSIGKPLFACCVVGIAGILLGILTIVQSKNCASLTPLGEQEYKKWRGLYNFLKSDTLLTERTHVELPLWEKYLVYATAFGISEKVIEAIRVRCVSVPPQTSIASTNTYRIRHIHTHSSSIRRSIHSSSHSFRSSSYGGGYNAGGRGIGGGGGGH